MQDLYKHMVYQFTLMETSSSPLHPFWQETVLLGLTKQWESDNSMSDYERLVSSNQTSKCRFDMVLGPAGKIEGL